MPGASGAAGRSPFLFPETLPVSEPTSTSDPTTNHDVVIIGAGPAGLTAAYMLTKHGVASTVLEADTVVGDRLPGF